MGLPEVVRMNIMVSAINASSWRPCGARRASSANATSTAASNEAKGTTKAVFEVIEAIAINQTSSRHLYNLTNSTQALTNILKAENCRDDASKQRSRKIRNSISRKRPKSADIISNFVSRESIVIYRIKGPKTYFSLYYCSRGEYFYAHMFLCS